MASYLTDMDEIHRIMLEAPDSSDDSWQSPSEDSIQSSGSDSESENAQTTRGSEQVAQFSTIFRNLKIKITVVSSDHTSSRFLFSKINI